MSKEISVSVGDYSFVYYVVITGHYMANNNSCTCDYVTKYILSKSNIYNCSIYLFCHLPHDFTGCMIRITCDLKRNEDPGCTKEYERTDHNNANNTTATLSCHLWRYKLFHLRYLIDVTVNNIDMLEEKRIQTHSVVEMSLLLFHLGFMLGN